MTTTIVFTLKSNMVVEGFDTNSTIFRAAYSSDQITSARISLASGESTNMPTYDLRSLLINIVGKEVLNLTLNRNDGVTASTVEMQCSGLTILTDPTIQSVDISNPANPSVTEPVSLKIQIVRGAT